MITDSLQELNNRYIILYSRLYCMRSILPPEQLKVMSDALEDSYSTELELILGHDALEGAQDLFYLRYRIKHYTPRRGLFGNKIARKLKKRYKAELKAFLKSLDMCVPPSGPALADEEIESSNLPIPAP